MFEDAIIDAYNKAEDRKVKMRDIDAKIQIAKANKAKAKANSKK